jgi:hypothetical protein
VQGQFARARLGDSEDLESGLQGTVWPRLSRYRQPGPIAANLRYAVIYLLRNDDAATTLINSLRER